MQLSINLLALLPAVALAAPVITAPYGQTADVPLSDILSYINATATLVSAAAENNTMIRLHPSNPDVLDLVQLCLSTIDDTTETASDELQTVKECLMGTFRYEIFDDNSVKREKESMSNNLATRSPEKGQPDGEFGFFGREKSPKMVDLRHGHLYRQGVECQYVYMPEGHFEIICPSPFWIAAHNLVEWAKAHNPIPVSFEKGGRH